MMRRVTAVVLFLLVAAPPAAGSDSPAKVTIFFSGEVQGQLEPCGCTAGPQGGVSRRVAYSRTFAGEHAHPTVQVDAGNYFQIPGPRAEPQNRFLFDTLGNIGMQVMNVGTDDLHLWNRFAALTEPRIISTNLRPADPGRETLQPFAVVEVQADPRPVRIGFVGLAWPTRVAPRSRIVAHDPLEAVAGIADELRRKADFWIVLADFNVRNPDEHAAVVTLAETYDEIAAVLYTEERFVISEPTLINNAAVLAAVERGRFLGQLTFTLGAEAKVAEIDSRFIALDESVGEVPEIEHRQRALAFP